MTYFEELSIELTDTCPLSCLHCSSNSGPMCSNSLSDSIVKKMVEEAALLGVKKISLGGGEPTIANNFRDIVTLISNYKIPLELFTSGITDSNKQIVGFSNDLIKFIAGVPELKAIFSIYGGSSNIHDKITQIPGSYDTTVKSLEGSLSAGICCEINFVPLKTNIQEIVKIVNIAQSYGLDNISVLRFVPQGRGLENKELLELTIEEEDKFVREILNIRESMGFNIRTGSPFNGIIPGNKVPCRAGYAKLVVQANGNVLPCEVFKHYDRKNWNLSVYDKSLSEIIHSEQIVNLRKTLNNSNCLKCPIHSVSRTQFKGESLSVK